VSAGLRIVEDVTGAKYRTPRHRLPEARCNPIDPFAQRLHLYLSEALPFSGPSSRIPMRITLNIVGALCLLTGCVWFLQGINVLPGSFMTGQTKWAVYGTIVFIVGVGFIFVANRRKR
jgi:hypothetical protein